MSLLDRVRAAAAGPTGPSGGAAAPTRGFEYVEVPSADQAGPKKRLTKHQFEALPLQERVGLLVQGTLRFYRGDHEVTACEAMRAAY